MKKVLVLVLALMMVLGSVAFAAGSPSIPSASVTGCTSDNPLSDKFDVKTGNVPSQALTNAVADMAAFVKNDTVFNYFSADVQAAIVGMLDAGVDTAALQLNAISPLSIANYDASAGTVKIGFNFTGFNFTGKAVVAVVACEQADGTMAWTAAPATVDANGNVVVEMSAELLLAVQAAPSAAIAILEAAA